MQMPRVLRSWMAVFTVLATAGALYSAEPVAGVTGLQVTPVTLSQLDLRWAPVEKAEGYNVYQSKSKEFVPSDDNWGKDAASFTRRAAGRTRDGIVEVGPLEPYEVRGYKLDRVQNRTP